MFSESIATLARQCQVFAGRAMFVSGSEPRKALLREFAAGLADPEQPAEKLLYSGLLLDVALRWGRQIHEDFHLEYPTACSFDPAARVPRYWQEQRQRSPRAVFVEWAQSFLDEFDRTHRVSPAIQAKAILDEADGSRVRVGSLAAKVGCHSVRLRSSFKEQFGISIREYQTRRRILSAARLLVMSELKVDYVAQSTGFRSRKNFYDAFTRIVGSKPAVVRGWSLAEVEMLERRLLPRANRGSSAV
jgi:AraC-like DNA-binding protein